MTSATYIKEPVERAKGANHLSFEVVGRGWGWLGAGTIFCNLSCTRNLIFSGRLPALMTLFLRAYLNILFLDSLKVRVRVYVDIFGANMLAGFIF